ncbi:MAG: ATP-binding protein [Candidatus Cyclobacteriaceae bacterium M3_2C_046]
MTDSQLTKIIILEDVKDDTELILDELDQSSLNFTYLNARNREQYEQALDDFSPDLILADFTLPDINGLEALKMAKMSDPILPVIFITGTLKVEKAVEMMNKGASDFVLKRNFKDLPSSIYRTLRYSWEQRERIRAVNALKESESRFRTIANSAPVLIWMTNHEGKAIFFNKIWQQFTGKSVEAGMNGGWYECFHPDDRGKYQDEIRQAHHQQISFKTEYRLKDQQGEYKWMQDQANVRTDDEGEFLGLTGSVIDITEQKVLEKNKNDFLSMASHELKTPLTGAKAYLQLLKTNLSDQDQVKFVEQAEKSINKLNHLIHDLLKVNQFEEERLELEKERVDYHKFLKQMVMEIKKDYPDREISLHGYSDKQIPIDRDKIREVLENLLVNALKYSTANKPVKVEVHNTSDGIQTIVKDQGIGIPAENQEKVFDRYFKVEKKRNNYSGLGIGLYISRIIVKAHGGKLFFESEEGYGASFYVELPEN